MRIHFIFITSILFLAASTLAQAAESPSLSLEDGFTALQDFRQAHAWYRRAAEQGSILAQNNLGLLYVNGQGVPRDLTRGQMWFNVAAAGASGEVRETAVKNRDQFAAQMSPQQLEQAQAMAWRCQQSKFKDCD
jgi:hypothetical protein